MKVEKKGHSQLENAKKSLIILYSQLTLEKFEH